MSDENIVTKEDKPIRKEGGDGPKRQPGSDFMRIHKITAGLDVHKETIVACVLGTDDDPDSYEIRKFGTLKKDLRSLGEWLLSSEVEVAAMESTGYFWTSPWRHLDNAGVNVILANARMVKNLPGRKTDIEDSRWLAQLARAGLVTKSRVLPQELSDLRELARLRQGLIEDQVNYMNRVHKLLVGAGFNADQVVTNLFGASGIVMIEGLLNGDSPSEILETIELTVGYRLKAPKAKVLDALEGRMSAALRFQVEGLMEVIGNLGESIAKFESELERSLLEMGHGPKLDYLETIPGVSRIAAMILLVELCCDLSDFTSAKALASWAGMCPGNNESAGKRKSGRTRHGNSRLKRILCEIAQAAVKSECFFKEKFKSIRFRHGYKKAIIAIGHKILKVIYHMLTNGEVYQDRTVDYETLVVKRNASRWLRKIAEVRRREAAAAA